MTETERRARKKSYANPLMADIKVQGNSGAHLVGETEWEEQRGTWEKFSGMAKVVERMHKRLDEENELPRAMCNALTQGPEDAVGRYRGKIGNLGIVSASFIMGFPRGFAGAAIVQTRC